MWVEADLLGYHGREPTLLCAIVGPNLTALACLALPASILTATTKIFE